MKGSETVQSFSVLNYSGLLYNKANTSTPFLNLISGNVKYTNSVEFVCGQYYTSEEGAIPEISETASLTAPDATFVTRSQLSNVTQIFMESVAISYAKQSNMATLSGVNIANQTANPQDELDFQVARKMEKIKRSIEKTFIQGTYNKAAADNQVNKTRGMLAAITTNVVAASGAALDLWLLDEAVAEIKAAGGDISNLYAFVNTTNLLQVNGNAVEELAKTGAGAKYQIFGQIGLDHGPEWYAAKITGLSTTFTAPVGQKVVTVASA